MEFEVDSCFPQYFGHHAIIIFLLLAAYVYAVPHSSLCLVLSVLSLTYNSS